MPEGRGPSHALGLRLAGECSAPKMFLESHTKRRYSTKAGRAWRLPKTAIGTEVVLQQKVAVRMREAARDHCPANLGRLLRCRVGSGSGLGSRAYVCCATQGSAMGRGTTRGTPGRRPREFLFQFAARRDFGAGHRASFMGMVLACASCGYCCRETPATVRSAVGCDSPLSAAQIAADPGGSR